MNQTQTAPPIVNRQSEAFKAASLMTLQSEIDRLTQRYGNHSSILALEKKRDQILAGQLPSDPDDYWAQLPYTAYLASERWRDLRSQALDNAGYRCQVCNSHRDLDVHHRCYARRGKPGEIDDLTVLCRPCHERVHADE